MKYTLALTCMLAALLAPALVSGAEPVTIKCLSTTSTENSGLTDYLLPMFENKTGIRVMLIARGTGAALEAGRRGDADVVLVHAKQDELKLVQEGYFIDRRDVMYNDFIILGPSSDPAGVKGAATARDAFKRISKTAALFISRGDNSGTHKKELGIWKEAGMPGPFGGWYMEVGQGMSKAMRIASEKGAYVLADRGTWLSKKDSMHLSVLLEGDPKLFNQYGVMAVNPEKHPHVKYKEVKTFMDWLVSEEGQRAIGEFKVNGKQLFIPNAGAGT